MSRKSRLKAKKRKKWERSLARRAAKRLLGTQDVEWEWKSYSINIGTPNVKDFVLKK